MEQKIALVNSLALLYLNSKLPEKASHSNLIKQAIGIIKTPDLIVDGDANAAVSGVKGVVNDLVSGEVAFDRKTVLQKIRVYCSFDRHFYQCIEEALDDKTDDLDGIRKDISACIAELKLFVNRSELKRAISRASYAVNNDGEKDLRDVAEELQKELAKYGKVGGNTDRPSLVSSVSANDVEAIGEVFQKMHKQLAGATLKVGWKGINRMLGVNDGLVPGELVLMPALPHNAKTTFSLSMFLSLAVFNKPDAFVEPGKKPLLLDLSFENELEVNIPIAYKIVKENLDGVAVDIRSVDWREAATYISQRLQENGWHYQFERHINSDFHVRDLETTFNYYEAKGYQIVGVRADYLGTISKAGLGNGTIGSDVRECYRLARNISSRRKALLLAPHQLSPKAKELKAMDPYKYVRQLPGKGFYDGCTTVDNEADLELYFGITEVNDKSYLEVQRGKHRTLIDTPLASRYRVLPFSDVGVLPWDYHTDKDYSLKSVNVNAMLSDDSAFLDSY